MEDKGEENQTLPELSVAQCELSSVAKMAALLWRLLFCESVFLRVWTLREIKPILRETRECAHSSSGTGLLSARVLEVCRAIPLRI